MGNVNSSHPPITSSKLGKDDEQRLKEWLETKEDRIEFDVSKERRTHLHRLCECMYILVYLFYMRMCCCTLFKSKGHGLSHESKGTGRKRTLVVTKKNRPSSISLSAIQSMNYMDKDINSISSSSISESRLTPMNYLDQDFKKFVASPSISKPTLSPAQAAAEAAEKRFRKSTCTSKPKKGQELKVHQGTIEEEEEEEELQRAIQMSKTETEQLKFEEQLQLTIEKSKTDMGKSYSGMESEKKTLFEENECTNSINLNDDSFDKQVIGMSKPKTEQLKFEEQLQLTIEKSKTDMGKSYSGMESEKKTSFEENECTNSINLNDDSFDKQVIGMSKPKTEQLKFEEQLQLTIEKSKIDVGRNCCEMEVGRQNLLPDYDDKNCVDIINLDDVDANIEETTTGSMKLLIDTRERVSNRRPRELFDLLERKLQEQIRSNSINSFNSFNSPLLCCQVEKRSLALSDYMWLLLDGMLANCFVERKQMGDLAGRSARACGTPHLEQLARLSYLRQNDTCARSFLLLEGDYSVAK